MSLNEIIFVTKENPVVVLALVAVVAGILWGFSVVFREFFSGKYSGAPQDSAGKKTVFIVIGVLLGCILLIILPIYPKLIAGISAVLAAAYPVLVAKKLQESAQGQARPRKMDSKWTLAVGAAVLLMMVAIAIFG